MTGPNGMIALTITLAILAGITVGMLGGGFILTVLLLACPAGVDAEQAFVTSLLIVAVTSIASATTHGGPARCGSPARRDTPGGSILVTDVRRSKRCLMMRTPSPPC